MMSLRTNSSFAPAIRRRTQIAMIAGLATCSLAVLAWAPREKSGDLGSDSVTLSVGDTKLVIPDTDGTTVLTLPDGRVLTLTIGPAAESAEPAVFEVVFVVDTTGSMSGLIEGAKQKIWAIASHIQQTQSNAEVRMGMVAYRDRGDEYVTKTTPLTSDIDAVHADLMQFQARGGGDTPESVNKALDRAFGEMQWSQEENVVRLVYLVGDAPPQTYSNEVAYTSSVPQARQMGITVHAIQCGKIKGTEAHWRNIAQLGGGSYASVDQDGGAVVIETPFDTELAELNRKLTMTIIPYGEAKVQAYALSQQVTARELDDSASRTANADRAQYRALNSVRMLGRGDLTTQLAERLITIDEIEAKLLPESLRDLDEAEQRTYIVEQMTKRVAVQKRITEIATKRTVWIRENGAALGQHDGFDDFIAKSIRDAVGGGADESADESADDGGATPGP